MMKEKDFKLLAKTYSKEEYCAKYGVCDYCPYNKGCEEKKQAWSVDATTCPKKKEEK